MSRQQIRFCTAPDGVRIAYAISGEGPPLLKAANWLNHLEYDWESPVWRRWLEEVSRHHTLIRYDERGCGLSDRDVEDLSFEAWVRDLETVVQAAGVSRFPLIGCSQGAPIAIAYAVRHPERVSRLMLHGSYARGVLKRNPTPEKRAEIDAMSKLAEVGWGQENPAFRQIFTTLFIPDGTPEQHQWFNELERVSTSPAMAARFFSVLNAIDVSDMAPKVACPTLVSHSRQDARVPFEEGRLVAGFIPGARFAPLESRNHIVLDHEPEWKRWLEEIRTFLAEGPASGAFAALTPRERELVELIAQGLDNAQCGARLDLSDKTVRNQVAQLYAKLEIENRGRLIVLAREAGFGRAQSSGLSS